MHKFLHPGAWGALALGVASLSAAAASAQGYQRSMHYPPTYAYYPYPVYTGTAGERPLMTPVPPGSSPVYYYSAPAPWYRVYVLPTFLCPPRAWEPGDPNPVLTHTNE